MDIKVGEYIRTGETIGKFKRIVLDENDNTMKWYIFEGKDEFGIQKELYVNKAYIEKHSFNIIDLIEVGDYVNGYRVYATYLDGTTKYIKLSNAYENGKGIRTYSENIKAILTKEQYERNCYKLEEFNENRN